MKIRQSYDQSARDARLALSPGGPEYLALCAALLGISQAGSAAQSIQAQNSQSNNAVLSVYTVGNAPTFGTYGVSIKVQGGTSTFKQDAPEVVEVITSSTSSSSVGNWNSWSYQSVTQNSATQLTCTGSVPSGAGTSFNFTDVYTALSDGQGFDLQRTVQVATPNNSVDKGFSTRFGLYSQASAGLQNCDLFVPGMSYHNTAYPLDSFSPSGYIASDLTQEYLWFREDRLALPVATLRMPAVTGGPTLELAHIDEATGGYGPNTWYDGLAPEDYNARLIDNRMLFGSIGFINNTPARPSISRRTTAAARRRSSCSRVRKACARASAAARHRIGHMR